MRPKAKTKLSTICAAGIAAVVALCACSEGKTSYNIETINGAPVMTINGKSSRPRVVWVTNDRPSQTLSLQHKHLRRTLGKYVPIRFQFSPEKDFTDALIDVKIGNRKGDFYVADVAIIDENGKEPKRIKGYDFDKIGVESAKIVCSEPERVETKIVADKKLGRKVLHVCLAEKVGNLAIRLDGLKLEKGKKYSAYINAKAEVARPLQIQASDKSGDKIYIAPDVKTATDQITLAAAAGVNFVSFGVDNFWAAKGEEPNYEDIAETFAFLVKLNPNIRIIPRLLMYPDRAFYIDWKNKHPDDFMQNSDGKKTGFVSVASPVYREEGKETLRKYIGFCEKNFKNNMAGYHPGGGNSHEWFYGDSWARPLSGYDTSTVNEWRKWLKKKYGDVGNLNNAWKNKTLASFTEAQVPAPEEREIDNALLNPQTSQNVIDFNCFLQDCMADTVLGFAKAAKETAGKDRLILIFYGYGFEFCSLRNGAAFSGHYALNRVVKSPYIDILAGPISYQDRYFGQVKSTMGATETISNAGKMWFDEDDTRTYLTPVNDPFYIGKKKDKTRRQITQANSIQVCRRNLAQEVLRNNGCWWMDLKNQNWYNDPVLWQQMSLFDKIENRWLKNPAPYRPEVRLIISEKSMMYAGGAGNSYLTTSPSIYWIREKMNRTGTPFGQYLFRDVLKRGEPAKLNVFLATYAMTAKQRKKLVEITSGSSNMWVWAPAYVDLTKGEFSTDAVREATGFEVREIAGTKALVRPTEAGRKIGLPELFGTEKPLNALLSPVPRESDTILATFPDGSPAITTRIVDGKAQMFCATPDIQIPLLKHMGKLANVHVYTDQPAGVYANGNLVSLTATEDGEYTVDFGTDKPIFDAYTDARLGTGPTLKFNLKEGDNRLLRIGE